LEKKKRKKEGGRGERGKMEPTAPTFSTSVGTHEEKEGEKEADAKRHSFFSSRKEEKRGEGKRGLRARSL